MISLQHKVLTGRTMQLLQCWKLQFSVPKIWQYLCQFSKFWTEFYISCC